MSLKTIFFFTLSLAAGTFQLQGENHFIDLRSAATTGFYDRFDSDRKDGWIDQGEAHDMRMIQPGILKSSIADFRIIDPAANRNKSCIVLGGIVRPWFPTSVKVQTPDAGTPQTLYLLHAISWHPPKGTPIGKICAEFSDGSSVEFTPRCGEEAEDWWHPSHLPNGVVVWRALNQSDIPVGLYVSKFKLPGKKLRALSFSTIPGKKTVWMIVGATVRNDDRPLPEKNKIIVKTSDEWRRFHLNRATAAGTALDFSFLADAPAGKYGRMQVRGDDFVFEKRPDTPVRFFGTNLCFSATVPTHAQADGLAVRIARCGYNSVRLHHFDTMITDPADPAALKLDKDKMDRFCYLISALKKQGLYITLDLYTLRKPKPETFGNKYKWRCLQCYKVAAMFDPEVNANLKAFAKNLLTFVNPYTQMTIAADPAVISMSLINENTLIPLASPAVLDPGIYQMVQKKYQEYLAAGNRKASTGMYRQFLHEAYSRYYDDMKGFIRSLGVMMPLTEQNVGQTAGLFHDRLKYDYVDDHRYHDHPQPLRYPAGVFNISAVNAGNYLLNPGDIAASRIYGKPFTVTEFDFCYPNEFRSEMGVLYGAIAALQDWNGIWHFAFTHNIDTVYGSEEVEIFDAVNDTIRRFSLRIAAAFFLRGDVKAGKERYAIAVPNGAWRDFHTIESRYKLPAFKGQLGTIGVINGQFVPRQEQPFLAVFPYQKGMKLPPLKGVWQRYISETGMMEKFLWGTARPSRVVSDTGEITLNLKKQTFLVTSPRSEAAVLPEGTDSKGEFLKAEQKKSFAVISAISLEKKPLAKCEKFLLLHLGKTDVEGTVYQEMSGIKNSGKVLVARGMGTHVAKHTVTTVNIPGEWRVFALDNAGRRLAELPFRNRMKLDNFVLPEQVIFAYEFVRRH